MRDLVAIYTRTHPAQAWKFEAVKDKCNAELEAGVNQHYGTSTRLIDVRVFCPKFLEDSTSSNQIRPARTLNTEANQ